MRPLVSANRDSSGDSDSRKETRLYKLTRRTVVAATVCLIVSMINVLVLAIGRGYERGVVCLTMCTVDVTINVLTIHWVMIHLKRVKVYLLLKIKCRSPRIESRFLYVPCLLMEETTLILDQHYRLMKKHMQLTFINKTY